jgi:hypothetical protein
MFFNNRGLTASSLVSWSNPYTPSQPIPYFSISVLVPRPTAIFRKILDRGHSYLRPTKQTSERKNQISQLLWRQTLPHIEATRGSRFSLAMEFKSFYSEIHDTEVDLPTREWSRCPLTQTLWCGGSSTCKSSLAWPGWPGSHFCVSWETLQQCGARKQWLAG